MSSIYVGNLSSKVNEENLLKTFSTFGMIKSVKIEEDSEKRKKNFGYIIFSLKEDTDECIFNMDGSEFFGNVLKVQFSKKQIGPLDKPIWDTEDYQRKYLNVEKIEEKNIKIEEENIKIEEENVKIENN